MMRSLTLLFTILAATQAFAGNWYPTGKAGANSFYWDQTVCQEKEGQECHDYTECPLDECSIGSKEVDNLNRPLFSDTEVDELGKPKIIGYEKMTITNIAVSDAIKKAAKDAAKKTAEDARKASEQKRAAAAARLQAADISKMTTVAQLRQLIQDMLEAEGKK